MLSSASQAAVDQLRIGDPQLEFVANAMQDALAAQNAEFVGQLKLIADYSKMNPGTEPPDYPNLSHDFPAVLTIVHETGFQKPGDTGPNGGCAMRVRGPAQFTPNREGDIAIDVPHGGIDAKKLYKNGEEVMTLTEITGYDSTKTQVLTHVNGVWTWKNAGPCA